MTVLLILTTGHTDVQFVQDELRHEIEKSGCRELYTTLLTAARGESFVAPPAAKAKFSRRTLPDGDLVLCAPKLEAALAYCTQQNLTPDCVLLLKTQTQRPDDPDGVAELLERRVKQYLPAAVVKQEVYLLDAESLADSAKPRDAVVRHQVVERIQAAIAGLQPTQAITACCSGPQNINRLVEAMVQALVSGPTTILDIKDGSRDHGTGASPGADIAVVRQPGHDPVLEFRARRRVMDLIQKGNFIGAWAVAEPWANAPSNAPWAGIVKWLYNFAASLPQDPACDIDVLRHCRQAARAALRTELALRAQDIPRAVHGTVAFFEAALWDGLSEWSFDTKDQMQGDVANLNSKTKFTYMGVDRKSVKSRYRFKKEPPNNSCVIETGGDSGKNWSQALAKPKLEAYFDAIKPDVKSLRNDVAHGDPTESKMNDAAHIMRRQGLWSATGTGHQFLEQKLVVDVLEELGVTRAGQLCDDLIYEVLPRLRT